MATREMLPVRHSYDFQSEWQQHARMANNLLMVSSNPLTAAHHHMHRSHDDVLCAPPELPPNFGMFDQQPSRATSPQPRGNSARYKTELCRPFEETGYCKYSDKCQFAHGIHELQSLSRHPKYKTDYCKTFHSTGYCPYGPRCHFIHSEEPARIRDIQHQHRIQIGQQSQQPAIQTQSEQLPHRTQWASTSLPLLSLGHHTTKTGSSVDSGQGDSPTSSLCTSPHHSPTASIESSDHMAEIVAQLAACAIQGV